MLSMDDIKYIRRMHDVEGCSIREIMRRSGYHYETVKKYLDMEDFNKPHYPSKELPSLLDPLKPVIDEWLKDDLKAPRKQRHTAKRVYERLKDEYPDKLEVKLRTVQYYVSHKKKELYREKCKGYLPLNHPAGEAQIDFCHFSYYDNAGVMKEGRKLTVSFPQSNAAYCQIFHGENQECLLQGIKNIIEYMNAVPYRMVFDNLSAAVVHIGKGHVRTLAEGFKRFIVHYGIEAAFCNPASGWEKGNVENKVGYERRNMFVPVPTILDFKQFNTRLFECSEQDMYREHYSKKLLISKLFEADKKAMLPLNPVDFKVSRFESAIADKYGKVMFNGNRYSSSPKYAKEGLYLEASSDTVTVMDTRYTIITAHPRLYGNGGDSMDWLPYIALMARRPNALKYTSFYDQLPQIWQEYLAELPSDKKKDAMLVLEEMLRKHDIASATDALAVTLGQGVRDADSILASYHRLTNPKQPIKPLQLSDSIIQMPTFQPNNAKYDKLFGKEAAL